MLKYVDPPGAYSRAVQDFIDSSSLSLIPLGQGKESLWIGNLYIEI
jgi:hypothetical protein